MVRSVSLCFSGYQSLTANRQKHSSHTQIASVPAATFSASGRNSVPILLPRGLHFGLKSKEQLAKEGIYWVSWRQGPTELMNRRWHSILLYQPPNSQELDYAVAGFKNNTPSGELNPYSFKALLDRASGYIDLAYLRGSGGQKRFNPAESVLGRENLPYGNMNIFTGTLKQARADFFRSNSNLVSRKLLIGGPNTGEIWRNKLPEWIHFLNRKDIRFNPSVCNCHTGAAWLVRQILGHNHFSPPDGMSARSWKTYKNLPNYELSVAETESFKAVA